MAESKSNVIEYVFQGDTLGLQQAVNKVRSMLTSTVKELKELQGGKLTAEQEKQVKHARALASQMAKAAKNESALTAEEKRKTKTAGKYALQEAQRLAKESARIKQKQEAEKAKIEQKAQQEAAAKQKRTEELVSTAGQEQAKQRATYLEEYADKFKQVLSEDAYDEIKNQVAAFRAATQDTTLSEEQLAKYTEELNQTFINYSSTLQAINRSQMQASKGILSISDFFKEGIRQAKAAVKTFSFWLTIIKKIIQAASQYQKMLEDLRHSGQLNNPKLSGIKETADTWRSLSRQISLFMTNIGALVSTVLAPVAKILSTALMVVNAIVAAITGVDVLAENTRAGAGLTNLDEINTQQETEEDQLKKMVRGWQDIKDTMQPVLDLAQSFGRLIRDLLSPLDLLWAIIKTIWNFVSPIIDGVLTGLNNIVSGIEWVLSWVKKGIDWFTNLLGVTGDWTEKGTALYDVLKWIGIAISGFVAIALSKWVVAAATSFATLAKNIALAAAKLVVYIAKQTAAIAKTIASTIANWWENASLAAKIGLVTLGAGLLVVPIALAAAGVFSSQANNVPAMATGGTVQRKHPTIALIGEGKYDEAVVPLGNSPQFASMKEEIADSTARKVSQTPTYHNGQPLRGGTGIPIILQIDGKTFARAILPDISTGIPQTGVKIQR